MLDLNYVRNNLDQVREALEKRKSSTEVLEDFTRLDAERREVIGEADTVNRQRNESSREIGGLIQQGKKDEAEAKKKEVAGLKERQSELDVRRREVETAMDDLLAGLPNIPSDDVPVGADEADNEEVRRWGEPRDFGFEPKDHVDLGEDLGILDLERAAKIAGTRFAILNGAGARLERALVNFMLDVQTNQHGYKETLPGEQGRTVWYKSAAEIRGRPVPY